MRQVNIKDLENWKEIDYEDELHRYFRCTGLTDWCGIAEEARNVYNKIVDDEIEEHSLLDAIFYAVAAQSADGMVEIVSKIFGVKPEDMRQVIGLWYDEPEPPLLPLTKQELKKYFKEARRFHDGLNYYDA